MHINETINRHFQLMVMACKYSLYSLLLNNQLKTQVSFAFGRIRNYSKVNSWKI